MSIDATRWAWCQHVKSSHKMVLLALADRAGENHECWPSISRLEHDTELDRKTIMSAIAQLEQLGFISVSRSLGDGNKYTLIGVGNRHDLPSTKNGTSPKNGTSTKNGTTPVPKTGLPSTKNGTPTSTKNGTLNLSIEPNNNLPRNIKENSKENLDVFSLLALFGIVDQLAKDFIKHRKTKRAEITQTALDGFRREADKAGISVDEAVRLSIERGWIGFKAEWVINNISGGNHAGNRAVGGSQSDKNRRIKESIRSAHEAAVAEALANGTL